MESTILEDGMLPLPVQLYQTQSEANFHNLQEGDEINRETVTDDLTAGFHIRVFLERVVHGTESKDADGNLGSPATFILIGFSFHGLNEKRRFRNVKITIRFEDEKTPLEDDPEVREMWPDDDYTLSQTTVGIQDTKSIQAGGSGGVTGGSASVTAKWERQLKVDRTDRAALYGAPVLRGRKFGKNNAAYITLYENKSQESGVVSRLRTAILLRRREGTDRFLAHFDIEAEADSGYTAARGVRKLFGKSHVTDPVIFKPGVQFFGRPKEFDGTPAIDKDNLDSVLLEKYGQAIATTQLYDIKKGKDGDKKKETGPEGDKKEAGSTKNA